jgi:hypothetical protein
MYKRFLVDIDGRSSQRGDAVVKRNAGAALMMARLGGHSRYRERILGGVSRPVPDRNRVALLIAR